MRNIKNINKLNIVTSLGAVLALTCGLGLNRYAYADCTPNGAYGQNCTYDKRFEIDKDVRFEGDSDWKDKITGVRKGQKIEFKITVKSKSETTVDSMKMIDLLPSELEWKSGDELVQYWEDFTPGEEKKFIFVATVRESEYDRKDFEKCVVNKAEGYYSDDIIGSATATVCYTDQAPKELPKTGPVDNGLVGLLGLVSTGLGLSLKSLSKRSKHLSN